MQKTTTVDIALGDYIRVDGVDVTSSVKDAEIHLSENAQPAVLLRLNGTGRVKGDAIVYVIGEPPLRAVAQYAKAVISKLNGQELEAACLEDEGWGENETLGSRMLRKIMEALDEADQPEATAALQGSADDGSDSHHV